MDQAKARFYLGPHPYLTLSPSPVVLKLKCASASLKRVVKQQLTGSIPRVSRLVRGVFHF